MDERNTGKAGNPLREDPITFEVIRGALYACCEEMKSVMTRAAFSPLLSLSADLSCALLDVNGDVVAQGNDIPVHLGAMPFAARGILARFPAETWARGDTVLANDPYSGGSHLPDMTMLSPIMVPVGQDEPGDFAVATSPSRLIGFAASRVHWPDIGGSAPGSSTVTDDIIKEGLRIPPVKVVSSGRVDAGLFDILFANVRVPEDRQGDFQAQIACNERGTERVLTLASRYGADVVTDVFAATLDYSEILVKAALERIPDGVYRAAHRLDGDGYVEDRGDGNLEIAVAITKHIDSLHFDFAGTSAQSRGPMNAPISVTASACYYLALALSGGRVPPNSGAYRVVTVEAPVATLVNATYPAPVVAANTEISNRLVDLFLDALGPGLGARAVGGSYGCAGVWTIGGFDAQRGRRFVHLETVGGGMGGSEAGPGLDGHRVHMGNTMSLPIEAVEAALPIRIDEFALLSDSGGSGANRGGWGARRVIQALDDGLEFSLLFERALHPALGANGGGPGRPAAFRVRRADGTEESLPSKTVAGYLNRGDSLWIETAGGGGYGRVKAV